MKLKGMKSIALLGLTALLVMASIAVIALADRNDVSPSSEESQDLGRSISLTAADIVGPEARVVGRLELRTFEEGIYGVEMVLWQLQVEEEAEALGFPIPGGTRMIASGGAWVGEPDPRDPTNPDKVIWKRAESVTVAFGIVVGPDGAPSVYEAGVNNEADVAMAHQRAMEWFKEQLRPFQQETPQNQQ